MDPESPSRGGSAAATCPVCKGTFAASGSKLFCGKLCKDTAYRRRKQSKSGPINVPPARPRRAITVYECDECGERSLGSQRCDQCRTFMRKLGLGGLCPHCEEPVTVFDLLESEVVAVGIR
ncbi:MAG: hypothetical protein ACT4OM_10365 [Actinomycetota bacterium]